MAGNSSISNELSTIENAMYGVDVRTAMHDALSIIEVLVVNCGSISSLPKTISDSDIKSRMVLLNYNMSNPSAMSDNWTVTTSNGSLTISGTVVSGFSTNLTLYLVNAKQE